MIIDLEKIPTDALLEIRNILKYGINATAETKKAKELKRLQAENERLKKLNERRDIVEDAGLEWDEEYYMSFNDKHFLIAVKNITRAMKQTSYAEKNTMKVPQMPRVEELSAIDLVDGAPPPPA